MSTSPIKTLLLQAEPGHPLLARNVLGVHCPPLACKTPEGWLSKEAFDADIEDWALILAYEGQVIAEGCDRASRAIHEHPRNMTLLTRIQLNYTFADAERLSEVAIRLFGDPVQAICFRSTPMPSVGTLPRLDPLVFAQLSKGAQQMVVDLMMMKPALNPAGLNLCFEDDGTCPDPARAAESLFMYLVQGYNALDSAREATRFAVALTEKRAGTQS